ncbi:protein FAM210A [Malaclemys terrapin pileata]|uniref:protein FAM210A n=1 Tax=Malaclemys terrapin pileata TaxID=2991368 RepID=UPI0023A8DE7C|nr:protein FAM210A [Malaclemys terrapin pileata]XP_053875251.1 protein FAM210A [Malaclemys terrapin pileata]XP_053875252.1 protein FAM210A [Malaclemys terrapin pileata]XP_053875253.1 protein FAM210A [Malaclemys terrapin pileata]
MQRNLIQTVFQLAHRTCLVPHRTGFLQHLKGKPVLPQTGCKVVLALGPEKQCLHASAALCLSKEGKSLGVFSSQPEGTHHKEQKEENPLKPASDIPQETPVESSSLEPDPLQDKSISLFQRFKRTFKQYGKVMIPLHLLTSSVWFGSFYYAAMKGVNVVPFLEFIGVPESIVSILKNSQSGYALTAYAMYKIATPARYTVTLGGTSITVKYLRKHGYMSTPPPVKEYLQDRMEETKERLSGKMEETKDRLTEKMEETKDRLTEKMEETKDRLTEKMEETKDRLTEKIQETKDKVSFKKRKE